MNQRLKELDQMIGNLQKENHLLKEENTYLKFQLKELQEKIYKKKHKDKEPKEDVQKKEPTKRGAKKNCRTPTLGRSPRRWRYFSNTTLKFPIEIFTVYWRVSFP